MVGGSASAMLADSSQSSSGTFLSYNLTCQSEGMAGQGRAGKVTWALVTESWHQVQKGPAGSTPPHIPSTQQCNLTLFLSLVHSRKIQVLDSAVLTLPQGWQIPVTAIPTSSQLYQVQMFMSHAPTYGPSLVIICGGAAHFASLRCYG